MHSFLNIMSCYQTFEQFPFFYIESGIHMNFNELFDSDEPTIFILYNVRMPTVKKLIQTCLYLAHEYPEIRILMIHLDAWGSFDFPVSEVLEYEYTYFDILEEEYSFTLNLECFHLEPEHVVNLTRDISISEPMFCVYQSGQRLTDFSNV